MTRSLRVAGLFLVLVLFGACQGKKSGECNSNTDCAEGAYCHPEQRVCFQSCEKAGCAAGHWCDPADEQCKSGPPELRSFTVTPLTIAAGQSATLAWVVVGADTVTLDQGIGAVTGTSISVSPQKSTAYTLTVANVAGSRSATVTVEVSVPTCQSNAECTASGLVCNVSWGICVVADCTGKKDFTACNLVTDPDRSYDICIGETCVSPGCGDETCNVPGPRFPLADTNQRTCYDATAALPTCPSPGADFYGQDAQYGWDTIYNPSLRFQRDTMNDPVVMDNVTGLMWQGCAAGQNRDTACEGTAAHMSWSDSLVYCDGLTWGGYTDWRLPDPYELDSILDLGQSAPAIDPAAFPATSAVGCFWSSSSYPGSTSRALYLHFYYGYVQFYSKSTAANVRCVRGGTDAQTPRYVRDTSSDPVVTDNVTNLMWQGCAAGLSGSDCASGGVNQYNWQAALKYCEDLKWAGHGDWRLPNRKELLSIVDDRHGDPAIDEIAFPNAAAGNYDHLSYVSSSSFYVDSQFAWTTSFDLANLNGVSKGAGVGYVRCVRSGP